jgi:hypothetical protein
MVNEVKHKPKSISTFPITLVISYLIVGYIRNTMFIVIDWVPGATIWGKLYVYYIWSFTSNAPATLIVALISTIVISIYIKRKHTCA